MTGPETTEAPAGKPKKSVALSGVTAGNTALCTVGRTGNDLAYRGYDILDIAETCEFEEVAYLLVHGKLPTRAELASYKAHLKSLRGLPEPIKEILERIPAAAHPMDVLRTGVSALGTVLPEKEDHGAPGARDSTDRLLASLGSMLLYWYHWSHNGKRIDVETDDDSIGGHFLHLLHGRAPKPLVGQGDAHVAHPVRRARVQRVDVHGARDRGHGLRLLFVHLGGDRRAARAEARRRERVLVRDAEALRLAGRRRGRHPSRGSRTRKSSSGSGIRCTRSPTRATR